MTLTPEDFCPSVDAVTLLQFRSEALQAWRNAPPTQKGDWLNEYGLISDLPEQSGAGPIKLGVP
jgi:hypothetical protein